MEQRTDIDRDTEPRPDSRSDEQGGRPDGVIRFASTPRPATHSIGRLAGHAAYVPPDAQVEAVADALREYENLSAIAVLDDAHQVLGVVIRREFFGMMVRAYAREVYKKRSIDQVMGAPITVRTDDNVFAVADMLAEALSTGDISYYVLVDRENRYCGLFSSQDLLLSLSRMTQDDIEMARQLQARIVRERALVVGKRFECAAHSQSAKGVGGDFYDVREYASGRWVVAFCDVSGKGVAASIITSVIWGMMNAYDFTSGLEGFIVRLNAQIAHTFESEKFVTGVFLEYDEASNRVRVCDLGHSHIYIRRNGVLKRITNLQSNLPIGIASHAEPRFSSFVPHPGDLLVLVTDGLIEQQNEQGVLFPFSSVSDIVQDDLDRPVELIAERIAREFHRFRGTHHLSDDMTLLLLRFVEQQVTL